MGPHETFVALSMQAGGSKRLFTKFVQRLEQWRNVAGEPPKQIELPPTSQEIKFNHDANCLEDETRLFAALSFDQIEEDVSLFVGPDVCAHHHLHTSVDE